jgi:hypothetical protein
MSVIVLSRLAHTWFIDIDGTVLVHNGYKNGADSLLPGIEDFWAGIPVCDTIVLLTAREERLRGQTLEVFKRFSLRFDLALFDLPVGERILINDAKPRGLATAIAVNLPRDRGLSGVDVKISSSI